MELYTLIYLFNKLYLQKLKIYNENPKFYILLEKISKTEKIPLIHFYVNPSNLKIEIYDPTEDIIMDLNTWQKNGGN